jgi:hypothetical protein
VPTGNGAAPRAERSARDGVFLVVSVVLTLIVLAFLGLAYRNVRLRGRDRIEEARKVGASADRYLPTASTGERGEVEPSAALQKALAIGREHPGDFEERRRLLNDVVDRFPGTKAAARAASELGVLDREMAEARARELRETRKQADTIFAEGRLADAARVLRDLGQRWPRTTEALMAERAAGRIEREIKLRWEVDEEAIEVLEDRGELIQALERLRAVFVYADPALAEKVKARIEKIHDRIQETLRTPQEEPPTEKPGEEEAPPQDEARMRPAPPDPDPEPAPRDPAAEREDRARKILETLWTDAREDRWGRVRELTLLLRGKAFRGSKVVHESRAELAALLDLAALEIDGPLGHLDGQVQELGGGVIRVTYDFRRTEQATDWSQKPFAVKGGGSFEIQPTEGLLRAKGSAHYVLDLAFEGNVKVGFRLRSERPMDIGAGLFQADDPMLHILFTVSNSFFTLGAERSALPGNVIMLWGPGKWADRPFGELGFIKVADAEEPRVQPGSWTYVGVGRKGDRVWFSISGETLEGTSRGDDGKGYGDLCPSLFVLNSRAEFTDLVAEGRVSRKWVKNRRKELRLALDLK